VKKWAGWGPLEKERTKKGATRETKWYRTEKGPKHFWYEQGQVARLGKRSFKRA